MHTSARRIDVADAAGVSESTVSRALSDSPLISQEVKDRVRTIARQLRYVPNVQAKHFAQQKTYRLGFVVRSYKSFPPFSRAYFPAVLDGAVLGAEERGYTVSIILDKKGDDFRDLVELVQSRQVDGLLIVVIPKGDIRTETLRKNRVPFVLINDYREECSSIDARPEKGISAAIDHMSSTGHSIFGFVTGDMRYRNANDRFETFNKITLQRGLLSCSAEGDFSRTSGYRCAGQLLQGSTPPSVIMTSSDRQALGVLDYCREHRICVPEDISVIGYDNLYPANDVTPALSTIDNPVQNAGNEGARLLADILENKVENPVNVWLDTGFVIRQSTGPCVKKEAAI